VVSATDPHGRNLGFLDPSSPAIGNRKVVDGNRTFQNTWTEEYFLIRIKGVTVYSESISMLKENSNKRHCEIKHA
jgi:hypothetical protein